MNFAVTIIAFHILIKFSAKLSMFIIDFGQEKQSFLSRQLDIAAPRWKIAGDFAGLTKMGIGAKMCALIGGLIENFGKRAENSIDDAPSLSKR